MKASTTNAAAIRRFLILLFRRLGPKKLVIRVKMLKRFCV